MDGDNQLAMLLVSVCYLGATVARLRQRNILSREDAIEILDQALLNLETQQGLAPVDSTRAFEMARSQLEAMLVEARRI